MAGELGESERFAKCSSVRFTKSSGILKAARTNIVGDIDTFRKSRRRRFTPTVEKNSSTLSNPKFSSDSSESDCRLFRLINMPAYLFATCAFIVTYYDFPDGLVASWETAWEEVEEEFLL